MGSLSHDSLTSNIYISGLINPSGTVHLMIYPRPRPPTVFNGAKFKWKRGGPAIGRHKIVRRDAAKSVGRRRW
jgi:hypothetical protein